MTTYRPVLSEHSGDWHVEKFAEFDRLKAQLGEPTPHMNIVRWMSSDADDSERLWRAGAYAAGYSVLTAEAIWREWPVERATSDLAGLEDWIFDNWQGIHTRTPRRAVRTPDKFFRCLASYIDWMQAEPLLHDRYGYDAPYDEWWASANKIDFMGRYIVIRLLELLRRWDFMSAELYDIRAMEAESPIRCLTLLVPERAGPLLAGDTKVADEMADLILRVASSDRSYFRFAALLCEYRKSYENQGDYPGNQTDEELGYTFSRYATWWSERGHETQLFAARRALVPEQARGENHGWVGQRKLAGSALREHGVNWTDMRYDWAASEAAGRPKEWT
ncbi:MAG TPA: hypothetical protein VI341_13760 [Actinomycetota bacterium]